MADGPTVATEIMQMLYGGDVYSNFSSTLPEDLQGWNSSHAIFAKVI